MEILIFNLALKFLKQDLGQGQKQNCQRFIWEVEADVRESDKLNIK